MKQFIKCIKTSFLFVGTVVGAGFATGEEIALYFADKSPIAAILSAALMSAAAVAFLLLKRFGEKNTKIFAFYRIIIGISGFVVYCAMLSAADALCKELWNFVYAPLIFAIFSAAVALSNSGLRLVNAIAVPLMTVFLVYLNIESAPLDFSPFIFKGLPSAILYAAMNTLFAGGILLEDKNEYTKKQIVGVGIISFASLSSLILLVLRLVSPFKVTTMPIFTASLLQGKGSFAATIIIIAIISTLTGVNKLAIKPIVDLTKSPILSVIIVACLGLLSPFVGFSNIVRFCYPVISFLGIFVTIMIFSYLLILKKNKLSKKAPFLLKQVNRAK